MRLCQITPVVPSSRFFPFLLKTQSLKRHNVINYGILFLSLFLIYFIFLFFLAKLVVKTFGRARACTINRYDGYASFPGKETFSTLFTLSRNVNL